MENREKTHGSFLWCGRVGRLNYKIWYVNTFFLSIIPSSVNGGQLGSSSAKSFLAGTIPPATQASISA